MITDEIVSCRALTFRKKFLAKSYHVCPTYGGSYGDDNYEPRESVYMHTSGVAGGYSLIPLQELTKTYMYGQILGKIGQFSPVPYTHESMFVNFRPTLHHLLFN